MIRGFSFLRFYYTQTVLKITYIFKIGWQISEKQLMSSFFRLNSELKMTWITETLHEPMLAVIHSFLTGAYSVNKYLKS